VTLTAEGEPMIATSIIVVATLVAAIAVAGVAVVWVDYVERRWRRQQDQAKLDPNVLMDKRDTVAL
jgi:hypothetical protein